VRWRKERSEWIEGSTFVLYDTLEVEVKKKFASPTIQYLSCAVVVSSSKEGVASPLP